VRRPRWASTLPAIRPSVDFVNVEDARAAARRALPRAVFDFVDGGALDETTLRDNRRAFQELTFRPRMAVHVPQVDLRTSVVGTELSAPIVFAPCGLMGTVHPDAEPAVARVAARVGTAAAFSTYSSTTIDQIAASASGGNTWFQLYFLGGRRGAEALLERARVSGCSALVVTVDTNVAGRRERDVRNGVRYPLRVGWEEARTFGPQVALRPAWLYRFARAGFPLGVANATYLAPSAPGDGGAASVFDEPPTWSDLEWIRREWAGPLIVKGVLGAEDALRAVDHGAEAVVVSNHGGRQLDGVPGALRVLPDVVEAVGGVAEVLVDGGVRRGGDVVKALALGARAVMIGRPYIWGLAAGGEEGVARIWDLLVDELASAMQLLGCDSVRSVGPEQVAAPGRPSSLSER